MSNPLFLDVFLILIGIGFFRFIKEEIQKKDSNKNFSENSQKNIKKFKNKNFNSQKRKLFFFH